uniref:Deoxyribonuclease-2-alpha n=1 Tax=Neogobius melanostomus TaxID=47308 RepID=A0A8C6V832_9GOBI
MYLMDSYIFSLYLFIGYTTIMLSPYLLYNFWAHLVCVVMGDSDSKTALWLTHSTPQFPLRRDVAGFWPSNGNDNAQTFMCVSLRYDDLKHNIRALPFDYDLPEDFHKELRDAELSPWRRSVLLTVAFTYFSLFSNANAWFILCAEGDLYLQLADHLKSDIKVQTWGRQKERTRNVQGKDHDVINIDEVKTDVGEWEKCNDHSKWAVTTSQNVHWTCIGDSNRSPSQSERPGGALCIKSKGVTDIFKGFINDWEGKGVKGSTAAAGSSNSKVACTPEDTSDDEDMDIDSD